MREKNGLFLMIIGGYFLFSLITGLILKSDIIESLRLDGMFNDSSVIAVYNIVIIPTALVTIILLYTGIRRYVFYRREKKEYKLKKKKEKEE